jgi:hypothetical protein
MNKMVVYRTVLNCANITSIKIGICCLKLGVNEQINLEGQPLFEAAGT